jgi:hypothetical protein
MTEKGPCMDALECVAFILLRSETFLVEKRSAFKAVAPGATATPAKARKRASGAS